jgi:hypothetical protein
VTEAALEDWTAAPGDPGYNGGRWMVHGLEFADYDVEKDIVAP